MDINEIYALKRAEASIEVTIQDTGYGWDTRVNELSKLIVEPEPGFIKFRPKETVAGTEIIPRTQDSLLQTFAEVLLRTAVSSVTGIEGDFEIKSETEGQRDSTYLRGFAGILYGAVSDMVSVLADDTRDEDDEDCDEGYQAEVGDRFDNVMRVYDALS